MCEYIYICINIYHYNTSHTKLCLRHTELNVLVAQMM